MGDKFLRDRRSSSIKGGQAIGKIYLASARSALLGGSGGMPPQKKFGF